MVRASLVALSLLFASAAALAGTSKAASKGPKVEEPEYVSTCHRVNPADGSLQQLERQTYSLQSKVKGLGFGGAKTSFDVPGTASPVRFPASETQRFAIRMSSKEADVSTVLKLVRFEAGTVGKKKAKAGATGTRQVVWVDQHGAFSQATVDPTLGALPILAKPFGESSIEFKPEQPLAPGEYGVLLPGSMTASCFGLD